MKLPYCFHSHVVAHAGDVNRCHFSESDYCDGRPIDPYTRTDTFKDDHEAPSAGAKPSKLPERIGRYRVEKILGEGAFGRVYLAHDDDLNRRVAIKVPHPDWVSEAEDAAAYLAEARAVASLDHPGIVAVYDVGRTDDGLCYVVSKFIEGSDLAAKIEQARPAHHEAAELVATVAEALHYAHTRGLVHRDIKPANIILDAKGKPFVADFGLALKEEDFGKGAEFVGTPAYMSPEQARGEGHRVDGRSDIFSLSAVLYELLVGKRLFRADSRLKLLNLITTVEVRPLRQVDDTIPKELERICIKALSKRATDRYMTAKDMAEDLRHFLGSRSRAAPASPAGYARDPVTPTPVAVSRVRAAETPTPTPLATPTSDQRPIKIVPKGLRSFDEHDADFFLELLPGPRDRDGLPDSIRFWKTRIEETDPDNTFAVGLIYGPSGCGKSSLVKAGLLPRLSGDVIAVYLESTANETEARLLNGIRKRCPALLGNLSLKETLAALRCGQGIPVGKKVLIVLDQFEQWLHAERGDGNTDLVQALRQCDGRNIQCVVLVRDDFWMAVTRFMRELEIRLIEGANSNAVDLFPLRHAQKVLSAFGRAFGDLPEDTGTTSNHQKDFLKEAVTSLAKEGKVVCVRLALFAEMMKGKPWTPTTLKEVGGTQGIGVTFLEETFSSQTANPEHRLHQKAARDAGSETGPRSRCRGSRRPVPHGFRRLVGMECSFNARHRAGRSTTSGGNAACRCVVGFAAPGGRLVVLGHRRHRPIRNCTALSAAVLADRSVCAVCPIGGRTVRDPAVATAETKAAGRVFGCGPAFESTARFPSLPAGCYLGRDRRGTGGRISAPAGAVACELARRASARRARGGARPRNGPPEALGPVGQPGAARR